MKPTRNDYPRPQFRRDDWIMLNGEWEFEFDDNADGVTRDLPSGKVKLGKKINVPFAYQYEASGIGVYEKHETVWYRRTVNIDKAHQGKRALLCFNGSDYITDVWVNGKHAVSHVGGCAPFKADVTQYLTGGENVIVVRCVDYDDPTQPRGKQSWTGHRFGCWYVPTTGIWQSVWVEFFGDDCADEFTLTPDIDKMTIAGEITTLRGKADEAEMVVTYEGKQVKRARISLDGKHTPYSIAIAEKDEVGDGTLWSPQWPHLYYIDLTLYCDGKAVDVAHTRFGMREISIDDNGYITLNHRRLYQRLVLDQGYWKDSGITPPSAQALKDDILAAQAMGFNGARKHQKLEDPYFYYYADELGFLTWCEMPSAYNFCAREQHNLDAEWREIVTTARAFTSVVCYVPLNESWGVRKIRVNKDHQNFAASMYYATKALDNSRLISTNDGWESVDTTDVIGVHDYASAGDGFEQKCRPENYDLLYPQGPKMIAKGSTAAGKPVIFTEFGGIALDSSAVGENWGYGKNATDADDLYSRLENLMAGVSKCPFQGYCYTQLTDVQQEVNGLLDEDHKPKADFARLKKIFEI